MVYWTSNANDFIEFFHRGSKYAMIQQDIVSLAICAFFSAIQVQIIWRLYRNLKASKLSRQFLQSSRVFGAASIALGVGFMVCTILLVTTTVIKLELVAKYLVKRPQSGTCPQGLTISLHNSNYCTGESQAYRLRVTRYLDTAVASLFQLMVLLADSLMVYRCYVVIQNRCRWIVVVTCVLALLGSLVCFILQAIISSLEIFVAAGTYISLLANLIVSPTLIAWIWRAKREMESCLDTHQPLSHTQIPYNRLMRILTESALPPLLLGFVHLGLYLPSGDLMVGAWRVLNVLWLIFTILAPQTIALRVIRGREHVSGQPTPSQIPTLPIAFQAARTNVSSQIVTQVEEERVPG
ncbi:hypothetical protein BKA70DRAFT_1291759 [Coprinopsis sp. MPI-PUGE-AT-0042]|nr:hypothetical protein BKA70DRAFT_1291759 [Coprinopsis sp. MPI-PUGE-AT-0042]